MKTDTLKLSAVIVAILAIITMIAVFASYMEAKTYRRLTGKEVTTWDAFWVRLRVADEPSK